MKKLSLLFGCLCFFFAELSAGTELVRNGESRSIIVIEENAPLQLKEAAEELKRFLSRISGADVPVTTPALLSGKKVMICVGENALTRKRGYVMPAFQRSGYHIFAEKDLVVLTGPVFRNERNKSLVSSPHINRQNLYKTLSKPVTGDECFTDFGPMHAVSGFLELLGVRFFAPGEEGIFIPRKKDIVLEKTNIRREAAFAVREYLFSPDREVDPELKRHLKFLKSGSSTPPVATFALAPILQKWGGKNPQWLALDSEGKPFESFEKGGYPRYSDASFREKCWEELEKFIIERPFLEELLILPPLSDKELIHFADEEKHSRRVYPDTFERDIPAEFYIFLAAKVQNRFPGVKLLYRSTGNTLPGDELLKKFPSSLGGSPAPQGVGAFAFPGAARYYLNIAEKFVQSTSKKKVLLREFWNEYDVSSLPRRGFVFTSMIQQLRQKQLPFVRGFLVDLPMDPLTGALNAKFELSLLLYVNSKLLWEPDADVLQLEKEYCRYIFGPAADEMTAFLRSAEKSLCSRYIRGLSPYYAKAIQREADELRLLLDKAFQKAPEGSVYRKRISEFVSSYSWMKKDIFASWNKKNSSQNGEIISRSFKLDGDLSKYKKWYSLSSSGGTEAPRTEAALVLSEDRNHLLAAFRCYEPRMEKLRGKVRLRDDEAIIKEDHVAVRIQTASGGEYLLAVNSKGSLLDSSTSPGTLQYTGAPLNWNSSKNAARFRRYPDRWELELSMVCPGRAPAPGRIPWKISLERSRFTPGDVQKSTLPQGDEKGFCDFYFPMRDAAGNKINERERSVSTPIPGVPDGTTYLVRRKKTGKIGFTEEEWLKGSWGNVPEARLGNRIVYLGRTSSYVPDVRFKMQYDERALYLFFKVREKGVRAVFRKDQENVFLDSCVELFLRPGKGDFYLNFEMNCIGTLLLGQVNMKKSGRKISMERIPLADTAKVRRVTSLKEASKDIPEEICWYAGLEIPWELITKYTSVPAPVSGTLWSGNIYKCADWSRFRHYLAWKEIKTFHYPEGFGKLIFE